MMCLIEQFYLKKNWIIAPIGHFKLLLTLDRFRKKVRDWLFPL